jgi:hypothetical protein
MGVKLCLLREEHKTEDGVPRGILGPKKGEAVGSWRKIHNHELQNLYSSALFSSSVYLNMFSFIPCAFICKWYRLRR